MENSWRPHLEIGGRTPLLSQVDTIIFKKEIVKRSFDLNCLSTKEGFFLVSELREKRYVRATFIAKICSQKLKLSKHIQETLTKLFPSPPSDSWFYSFCEHHGIILKNNENIEIARQECCNQFNIRNFFNKFKTL